MDPGVWSQPVLHCSVGQYAGGQSAGNWKAVEYLTLDLVTYACYALAYAVCGRAEHC